MDTARPDPVSSSGVTRAGSPWLLWACVIVTGPFLVLACLFGLIGTLSTRYALIGLPVMVVAGTLLVAPVVLARRGTIEGEAGSIGLHVLAIGAIGAAALWWELDPRDEWLRFVGLGVVAGGGLLVTARAVRLRRLADRR